MNKAELKKEINEFLDRSDSIPEEDGAVDLEAAATELAEFVEGLSEAEDEEEESEDVEG